MEDSNGIKVAIYDICFLLEVRKALLNDSGSSEYCLNKCRRPCLMIVVIDHSHLSEIDRYIPVATELINRGNKQIYCKQIYVKNAHKWHLEYSS